MYPLEDRIRPLAWLHDSRLCRPWIFRELDAFPTVKKKSTERNHSIAKSLLRRGLPFAQMQTAQTNSATSAKLACAKRNYNAGNRRFRQYRSKVYENAKLQSDGAKKDPA
jgi:hypothetical protein